MSKIAVVYGTRPEMIKLAPIVKLLGDRALVIHTGQHFDPSLSEEILSEVSIHRPEINLGVGGQTRAAQIGNILLRLEDVVVDVDGLIVQGDTNSGLAGAMTANALNIPLFHVEAGLRSFDRRMPEEHNRVLIDHLSDMCWAPTEENVLNLKSESVDGNRVIRTGNSVVEALEAIRPTPEQIDAVLADLGIAHRKFVLVTLHRPENVDDPERLGQVLDRLGRLSSPVIFPMHPRTRANLPSMKVGIPPLLRVVEPVGYRTFLALMSSASLVISDSGGVQEEVSILKVPMVVLRRSTERPEVLGTFASLTDDADEMCNLAISILESGERVFAELAEIPTPYGDGSASQLMIASLNEVLARR